MLKSAPLSSLFAVLSCKLQFSIVPTLQNDFLKSAPLSSLFVVVGEKVYHSQAFLLVFLLAGRRLDSFHFSFHARFHFSIVPTLLRDYSFHSSIVATPARWHSVHSWIGQVFLVRVALEVVMVVVIVFVIAFVIVL